MAKTNWGAGLQALGQGLAGLAEMQWQRQQQEAALAREDQLRKDLYARQDELWERDKALYDERDPLMTLPSGTVNAPFLSMPGMGGGPQAMPNPAYPQFLPPGMTQIRQSQYLPLQSEWMQDQENDRQQAARDAALFGQQMERDRFGLGADWLLEGLRNKNARDLLALKFENTPPEPMGGYTSTEIKLAVQGAVTDEERKIWGQRIESDTEAATMDLLRRGYSLGPQTLAAAKDIAHQLNAGASPDVTFGMQRAEIPGQGGVWYDPRTQMVGEVETKTERPWWRGGDKEEKGPGIVPIVPLKDLPPNQRLAAMAAPLTDSTFVVKNIRPALERGALKNEDLQAVIEQGITAEELNRILGIVRQVQADSTATTVPDGF